MQQSNLAAVNKFAHSGQNQISLSTPHRSHCSPVAVDAFLNLPTAIDFLTAIDFPSNAVPITNKSILEGKMLFEFE